MRKKVHEIEVGLLLVGTVRDHLTRLKLQGHDIDWREGSGILSKTFFITGSRAHEFCLKIHRLYGS